MYLCNVFVESFNLILCQESQEKYPEVEAFIDKFLLGKKEIDTSHIVKAPWNF